MSDPRPYPLDAWTFENWWFCSKGHHDKGVFAAHLKARWDVDVNEKYILHGWARSVFGTYTKRELSEAAGPGRGVFPITEVTVL